MVTLYIVNTYTAKGNPEEGMGCHFSVAELGAAEALRQANEAFEWYATRGARVKLLAVS